jgi:hypothetical protein
MRYLAIVRFRCSEERNCSTNTMMTEPKQGEDRMSGDMHV